MEPNFIQFREVIRHILGKSRFRVAFYLAVDLRAEVSRDYSTYIIHKRLDRFHIKGKEANNMLMCDFALICALIAANAIAISYMFRKK